VFAYAGLVAKHYCHSTVLVVLLVGLRLKEKDFLSFDTYR